MEIFRQIALGQIPRILGFQDRNPKSRTYGCFDRFYWHYKLHDMSNAGFQEASLTLAIIYKNSFPENIYYKNNKTKDWLKAAVKFWLKLRNFGGSFNEVYPYERSYCATSFSTYANTEAILLAKLKLDTKRIAKIGKWLTNNNNPSLSNQMAASAIALQNIYLITKKDLFKEAAEQKIKEIIKMQDQSGYYPEYGGFDIGYQTITLSCLTHYYLKTKDTELYKSLKKGTKFLDGKIKSNGTYDNSKTSRKTQYIFPFGLVVLKSPVIGKMITGLENNEVVNPTWMDDRYCIHLTTNYLQAYLSDKNVHESN